MSFLYVDKDIAIEKYTLSNYLLIMKETGEKNLINKSAYEMIKRLDGTRSFKDIVEELSHLFNENSETVEAFLDEFILSLTNQYGIDVRESEVLMPKTILESGEQSYYPKAASIEITEKCNLKCIHCYGSFGCGKSGEMSLDEVKQLLDELEAVGVQTIELTGGDVSTYDKLYEVIEYALGKEFERVHVLTNSIVLDERVKSLLINNKNRTGIQIDLHSLDDDYLYWFTGARNSLQKIKYNIEYFAKEGIPLRVATIFTKKNLHEFEAISDWVGTRGIKWGIGQVESLGRGSHGDPEMYLKGEASNLFGKKIMKAMEKYPGMIAVIDQRPIDENCGAITSHVMISTAGNVKLCAMDDGTHFFNDFGNCFTSSIKYLYDNNEELVRELAKYEIDPNVCEECKQCSELNECIRCLLRQFINIKERGYNCQWFKNYMPEKIKRHFFHV